MRRRRPAAALAVCTIYICTLLSGCTGIWGSYRAIQRLLVVETMGFDTDRGSVRLSLASAANGTPDKPPRRLSAAGSTISSAVEHVFNGSYEKELFCYHVDNILVGEGAAEEGLEGILTYICQSPFVRVDVPLFVVREGTAEQAVMELGDEAGGVSELLQGASERVRSRGGGRVFSAADVIRDSARRGCALICAISCGQSTESSEEKDTPEESEGQAAAASGYAVIRDGKLCAYIEPEDTAALGLLLNEPGIAQIQVRDMHGRVAVLETDDGSSAVEPVWSGPGVLDSINIRVRVRASVLELNGRSELSDAEYCDHLTAQLEKQLLERVNSLLASSQKLRADFLGLGEQVQRAAPEQFELMTTEFYDTLPNLRFSVTVSGQLSHTNDKRED